MQSPTESMVFKGMRAAERAPKHAAERAPKRAKVCAARHVLKRPTQRATRHVLKRTTQRATSGQATVEFAVVLFGFLALLAGLGALADFTQSGALVEHAAQGASHAVGSGDSGAWADVLAY